MKILQIASLHQIWSLSECDLYNLSHTNDIYTSSCDGVIRSETDGDNASRTQGIYTPRGIV